MRHKPVFVTGVSGREGNAAHSSKPLNRNGYRDRPFVGGFSERVHLQKLLRGERPFGESATMDLEKEECGVYYKGDVLKDVKIKFPDNLRKNNQFQIYHKKVTSQERDMLQRVPSIKINGNHKMYQSNPYNSDIGCVKLYLDKSRKVHRCRIEDIFCRVVASGNGLYLRASITLIDSGVYVPSVDYYFIYDFSQRTNYLEETEPETFVAHLHLPNHSSRMTEIYSHFRKMINSSARDTIFNVKLFDFKHNCYKVDIITESDDISYLGILAEKFEPTDSAIGTTSSATSTHGSNEENHSLSTEEQFVDEFECTRVPPPSSVGANKGRQRMLRKKQQQKQCKNRLQTKDPDDNPSIGGAMLYFQKMLQKPSRETSYVARRLCTVMVLDWLEPDQMTILPFDRAYTHDSWIERLQSLKCVKTAADDCNIKEGPYAPGEFIFFKNYYRDEKLGPWLRGRVVSLSCYNERGLVISQRRTEKAKRENFKILQRLVEQGRVNPDDLVYRVRSIDYGCECRASPIDMRCVRDLESFKSLGTWSLRCKLFGIYPYESDRGEYSMQSLDSFNSWVNERFDEDETGFRVLFRNYSDSGTRVDDSFDKLFEVSLFHRYNPALHEERFGYLLKPEKERFDCLNWYMVDNGFASSSPTLDGPFSQIMLEDHVISRLVAHKKV